MASGCSRLTASYCSRTGTGFRVRLIEDLASKLPGGGVLDAHSTDGADLRAQGRGPDHHPVLPGPPGRLPVLGALNQHLDGPAQPAPIRSFGDPPLGLEQHVDATFLLGRRHVIRLPGGGRARSWREALDVDHVELDL